MRCLQGRFIELTHGSISPPRHSYLGGISLCCGSVLCPTGCWAASPTPAHRMPGAPHPSCDNQCVRHRKGPLIETRERGLRTTALDWSYCLKIASLNLTSLIFKALKTTQFLASLGSPKKVPTLRRPKKLLGTWRHESCGLLSKSA